MSNAEHVAILKKGASNWNNWRRENPHIVPELDTENLSGSDLSGRDFSGAELYAANLDGANLEGSNLEGASLGGARLRKAVLSMAVLADADLTWSDLDGADLHGADLQSADLTMASLRGTDFTNSAMGYTTLENLDLSTVIGLETVVHHAPSTIGVDIIYRSHGRIPEVFLRGLGLLEDFITYIDSFIAGKAIQFYSVFISYSSKDDLFAKRLHADLQAKKVRVWFAPEDLKIGARTRQGIDEAIRVHDKVMVVLSKQSVESDWVEKEVETAFERERREKRLVLFPIRLDNAVMKTDQAWAAELRRTRNIGDFSKWKEHDAYQKAFDRLLRDLQADSKSESVGANNG